MILSSATIVVKSFTITVISWLMLEVSKLKWFASVADFLLKCWHGKNHGVVKMTSRKTSKDMEAYYQALRLSGNVRKGLRDDPTFRALYARKRKLV